LSAIEAQEYVQSVLYILRVIRFVTPSITVEKKKMEIKKIMHNFNLNIFRSCGIRSLRRPNDKELALTSFSLYVAFRSFALHIQ